MGKDFFQRLTEGAEALPGRPIVELSGDRRVLIEHHFGVKEYGRQRITVAMAYGQAVILGQNLEILRMTRDQLVIRGSIRGISLEGREGP